jgi:hypothetical protein
MPSAFDPVPAETEVINARRKALAAGEVAAARGTTFLAAAFARARDFRPVTRIQHEKRDERGGRWPTGLSCAKHRVITARRRDISFVTDLPSLRSLT